MKGVILGIAPDARVVDVTHDVPAQDIWAGGFMLRSAVPYFPRGTIHVAVVDPGVGTRRRALLVETRDAFFVAPDNGIVSLAAKAPDVARIYDVSTSRYRLQPVSRTFHGRDVFAPVAAHLAAGVPPARLGRPLRRMMPLASQAPRRRGRELRGTVIWIDRFSNLITNITRGDLAALGAFRRRGVSVTILDHDVPLRASYAGASVGRAVALVNSADLLEIAVNRGAAAEILNARRGTPVTVRAH
jgi:S-adenosylmethionine hydrolase